MKNDRLIFIHIPKTGGLTMQGILNRQYGKNHVFDCKNNREAFTFKELPAVKKNQINVLKGHMAYGHHSSFLNPKDVTYFTMLRDPIKRIISNYYFILQNEAHHTHKKIIDNNYSLKEYVEHGITANTENAQVRLLSDNIDVPHGKCTREMLDRAKKNLEKHFPVIGVNEYFDESVLLLQDYFDWRTPYYARDNVTGHGVKITDLEKGTIDAIIKYNSLDIELYEWVKDRLENQLKSQNKNFFKRLKRYKKINSWIEKVAFLKRKLIG